MSALDGPAYGTWQRPEPLDADGNSLLPPPLERYRRARREDTPLARMAAEVRAWHQSPAVTRQRRLSELSALSAAAAGEAARYRPAIPHRTPRPGTGRRRLDPRVAALDRRLSDDYGSTRPAPDEWPEGDGEAARGDYDTAHYDLVGGVSYGELAREGMLDPSCPDCAPVLARLGDGDW